MELVPDLEAESPQILTKQAPQLCTEMQNNDDSLDSDDVPFLQNSLNLVETCESLPRHDV